MNTNWQPVAVPDLCPTCGAYWECEHAGDATLSFGPASDFRIKTYDDSEDAPDHEELEVPDGVLEIAARMGISPKEVTDELTRIQQEQMRRLAPPDSVRQFIPLGTGPWQPAPDAP